MAAVEAADETPEARDVRERAERAEREAREAREREAREAREREAREREARERAYGVFMTGADSDRLNTTMHSLTMVNTRLERTVHALQASVAELVALMREAMHPKREATDPPSDPPYGT